MGRRSQARGEGGSVLVLVLVFALVLAIGTAAFLAYTMHGVAMTRQTANSTRAFYYAEAGLNYALHQAVRGWELSSFLYPFHYLDNETMTTLPQHRVLLEGTPEEGEFYAEILEVSIPYDDARDIHFRSTGTYRGQQRTIEARYRLELAPSRVFDYMYFMNHWGWFQGIPQAFTVNGNMRANGYFSFAFSQPWLHGHPEYERVSSETAYKDSGGIYSAFDITGADSVLGMGGLHVNHHKNEDSNGNGLLDPGEDYDQDGRLTVPMQVPMPNISDQAMYEQHARAWNDGLGGSIKVQGAGEGGSDLVVSNAVYGDDLSENEHLILWGTEDNPIVIDGPVVVRGELIIKGYVTGRGCIFVYDNIYIPDNLLYVDPPAGKPDWDYFDYSTPEARDAAWQAASAEWKAASADKDGLGLFARENVIIGDFNDSTWVGQVSSWLNHSANESAERANGLDHLPNTNDYGEGDSVWQVDRYTQQDAEDGLLPPGKSVGDVVPGSGEDIDGDGIEDGRINTNEFALPAALKEKNWGGWMPIEWPPGGLNFSRFLNANGGLNMNEIDALLYTNHALVGAFGKANDQVVCYGGWVSRVEAVIIYSNGGGGLWTHDERFTGGGGEFGFLLPRVKRRPELVSWTETAAIAGQE